MPAFGTHKTGTADVAWDAGAQEKKVRTGEARSYYAKIYAWYDATLDEGNKSTYKFIHHEVSADGTPGDAVVKACTLGIGVLNGGMGGTTIPKADHQGVWNHLAKHLRDAGREPPPLNGEEEIASPAARNDGIDVMRMASGEVWAILPDYLRAALMNFSAESIVEAPWDADLHALTRPGPKNGRVARVPILGPISQRSSMWSAMFGGTSVEWLMKALQDVSADETISTVLLDIDSPGGTVSGLPDLAAAIRQLRESKQVVALANDLAASAAYWIASQADEIVATPEAMTGSIGVFTMHEDMSKFLENAGVKVTYISAPQDGYKTEGNADEPLTIEARDHLQGLVNEAYDLFVNDVARGRNISAADVRSNYGRGRVMGAKAAKAAGLIDKISGPSELMRRMMGTRQDRGNSQARFALMRRRLEIAEKTFEEGTK